MASQKVGSGDYPRFASEKRRSVTCGCWSARNLDWCSWGWMSSIVSNYRLGHRVCTVGKGLYDDGAVFPLLDCVCTETGLARALGLPLICPPLHLDAGMAELADAVDSKSTAPQKRASSSLAPGIISDQ